MQLKGAFNLGDGGLFMILIGESHRAPVFSLVNHWDLPKSQLGFREPRHVSRRAWWGGWGKMGGGCSVRWLGLRSHYGNSAAAGVTRVTSDSIAAGSNWLFVELPRMIHEVRATVCSHYAAVKVNVLTPMFGDHHFRFRVTVQETKT